MGIKEAILNMNEAITCLELIKREFPDLSPERDEIEDIITRVNDLEPIIKEGLEIPALTGAK